MMGFLGKKGLPWDDAALKGMDAVPKMVRPMVRRKVEERVKGRGGDRVTLADWQEAEARFKAVSGGKSEKDIEKMLPQDNQAGVDMVVLESCRSELARCPNGLIPTAQWREAVEDWIKQENLSERLRARVKDDKVLFHHKLKITISGCPNGCSRPQIADLGLVGFVRPSCLEEDCTFCATCEEVCPDSAITVDGAPPLFDYDKCQGCLNCRDQCPEECIQLSRPGVRLTVGGKLGRHPHLGEPYAEAYAPEEALAIMKALIEGYLDQSQPNERFSAWWVRQKAA